MRTCPCMYKNMAFQSLETHCPLPQLPWYRLLEWNTVDLAVALPTSSGKQNPPWSGVGQTTLQGGLLCRC